MLAGKVPDLNCSRQRCLPCAQGCLQDPANTPGCFATILIRLTIPRLVARRSRMSRNETERVCVSIMHNYLRTGWWFSLALIEFLVVLETTPRSYLKHETDTYQQDPFKRFIPVPRHSTSLNNIRRKNRTAKCCRFVCVVSIHLRWCDVYIKLSTVLYINIRLIVTLPVETEVSL